MKIAVCIRGHIRDSLFNRGLSQWVDQLHNSGHEVHLYLHTWLESEAKSSYRELDRSYIFDVNENLLYSYFKKYTIKKIIIDDDKSLKILGKKTGVVSASKCPLLAWKRMWAGQYKIIEYIYNCVEKYDLVINTRFDMFTTPICYTPPSILNSLILQKSSLSFKYPLYSKTTIGVDNFYCGHIENIYKLISSFHYNLDKIIKTYPDILNQEELVYRYSIDNNLI